MMVWCLRWFHSEEQITAYQPFVEYFTKNLIKFLTPGNADVTNGENQPRAMVKQAVGGYIGKLSRIFDSYPYPVPSYRELMKMNEKPNGLGIHMQENLEAVLPYLLNKERNGLNQDVINAIGQENYDAMLSHEQVDSGIIATQFLSAIYASYSQRIWDANAMNDQNNPSQDTPLLELMTILGKMATQVTLTNFPDSPGSSHYWRQAIDEFLDLLDRAKEVKIGISEADYNFINGELQDAKTNIMDSDEPGADIVFAQQACAVVAKKFITAVNALPELTPPQVSFVTKLLRCIFGFFGKINESREEKSYETWIKLNKLAEDIQAKFPEQLSENGEVAPSQSAAPA